MRAAANNMSQQWNDDLPIYRQLRDLFVQRILQGEYKEGEPIPSVRQVAKDYRINHLTVSKSYQMLVDAQLVEKRRGVGMFVAQGARSNLTIKEKQQFISEALPAFLQRAQNLGLSTDELLAAITVADGGEPEQ